MPSRPNSPLHPTNTQHHTGGMHPYESVDRFAPSISLQIRNSRRQGTINSVQDIDLPPSLSHRAFKKEGDEDGTSLNGRPRSSFESGRSRVGVAAEIRSRAPIPAPSNRPLGGAVELEIRTGEDQRGSSLHSQLTIPEESDFMQETRIPYRNPSRNHHNHGSAHRPPAVPTADLHKRSNSSISFMTRRHRTRQPSFSESFLPALDDEEKAESKTSGSPHSKSLRSPRLGGRTALDENITLREEISTFVMEIVPHQVYLHCLLRLPYLYFSRVNHIFENANLTLEQMKDMALQVSLEGSSDEDGKVKKKIPKGYWRLKRDWERFIDCLLREWKTLNIISGLLLSGILTVFQIDGTQKDPVTRYMAFWSLISALLSLLYGCIFIIRFSGLRSVYQATEWAIKAQQSQALFWNVWVMLSMPAVWLVWSILAYIACIMAFMWRVHPDNPNPTLGPPAESGFKIFICCVLGVGVLYAILIVNTLRHYGSAMDKSWRKRIAEFRSEQTWKEPQTPTLSPLLEMQVIEPTPPQTYSRLSSSAPRQAHRPSSPLVASQIFPSQVGRSTPYVPLRPSVATQPAGGSRESFNSSSPPSLKDFGQHKVLNLRRSFSASPTPMTPEATTPAQSARKLPSDEVPGTPETGNGTLGLIFNADREDIEEAVSSSGLDKGPGISTRQRTVVGGETTEPNSDTTLVVQVDQHGDSDPIINDEGVGISRDELRSLPLEEFRPPSASLHLPS